MAEKHLTEAHWRACAKGRNVKDAALVKALADFAATERGTADGQLKALDAIDKQAQALSKLHKADKDIAAYLAELDKALGRARKAADAVAAKEAAAAKLAAATKPSAKPPGADADVDDEEATPALLTTKMLPLLKLAIKGEPMHVMVASAGKQVSVLLSRKPIATTKRKLLAEHLGVSGGVKYFTGQCAPGEGNAPTFTLQAEVAGMAKKMKAALLAQTGLRVNKLRCRGLDGATDHDDDDDGEGDASPSVAATSATTGAAARAGAPAPSADALTRARTEWRSARSHAVGELTRLKGILRAAYRDADTEQAALATALQRVDATIGAIDDELGTRLEQMLHASPSARAEAQAAAKATVARLTRLMASDQILSTIDGNELAPDMKVAEPLRTRLREIAAALA